MTRNWTYKSILSAAAAAASVVLCPVAVSAQSSNPWTPYPVQHTQPTPVPAPPAPKPKYYQEPAVAGLPRQALPSSPSRFAPADLAQRLSAAPQRQQYARPYGNQAPAMTPYPNAGGYFGQRQGPPQGYSMNAPPSFGGYGPPIIGTNSWGGAPGNNFIPYGY